MENLNKIIEWDNYNYLNLYNVWVEGTIPRMSQN